VFKLGGCRCRNRRGVYNRCSRRDKVGNDIEIQESSINIAMPSNAMLNKHTLTLIPLHLSLIPPRFRIIGTVISFPRLLRGKSNPHLLSQGPYSPPKIPISISPTNLIEIIAMTNRNTHQISHRNLTIQQQ